MSFAEQLAGIDLAELRARSEAATARQVQAALAKPTTDLGDFLALLSPAAIAYLEPMAQRARRVTIQRFGRAILLYAPLYLSNHCINGCLYCGFSTRSRMERTILTDRQVLAEGRYLHDQGFRHLLLVSGESPREYPNHRLETAITKLSPLFASVSIEVQALSEPDYRAAVQAGAEGVTLYQETYHRETYARLHPSGPKRDFTWRLDASERAARAGMRRLGIGALLGLHDFRAEAAALCLHAEYLLKTQWRTQVTVSVPRLRHAPDGFAIPNPVGDRDLVQMLLALRIHLPDVGLVLSTREPASLRDRLIPLGITQMSAGSRTEPGGYLHEAPAAEQFAVEDARSPAEVAAVIRQAGYDAVWKDWDTQMRGGPGA